MLFMVIIGIGIVFVPPCRAADDDEITKKIQALQDKDTAGRGQIARELGLLRAKAAIPALIAALDDNDDFLVGNAAVALSHFGADAVQPLIGALGGPNARAIGGAADALRMLGPKAKAAVPHLIQALKADEAKARINVVRALGRNPDQDVAKALASRVKTDPDFGVRAQAAEELGNIGSDAKEAVPTLIATIREMNERSKLPDAPPVPFTTLRGVTFMTKQQDAAEEVHDDACTALARIGEPAVPNVVKLLDDAEKAMRRDALVIIRSIGPKAKAAVPALIPFLEEKDQQLRCAAMEGLSGIGPGAAAALPALRKMSADVSEPLRLDAAAIALQIKSDDGEPLKVLLTGLADDDTVIRSQALECIHRRELRSDKVVEAMGVACKDKNQKVAELAAKNLVYLAPSVPSAILPLPGCLEDERDNVRHVVVFGLKKVRNEKRVVPGLIRSLHDADSKVRVAAAEALAEQGAEAAPAIPTLSKIADGDEDDDVRAAASQALTKIERARKQAIQKE
jgi:HEAT repeat protein